ncbi:MAG: cbb3-type cytochrome c oxidase N-terminal domain-containing protein [Luteolibacter sp.]|uniref:cbb3-type cytochrome c oxidase N-terminal domain-containing protein n=1 Tax=Luteolibacter sp. TaxID=1962973 RepID=UPI003264EE8F
MNQEPKRGHFAKEKGEVILREHEFDGIQEYDQKLPNWWLFTFYGAIVWFVVYWALYYHTSLIKSDGDLVKEKIVAIQAAKAAELEKTLATLDDATLVHTWATDPERVAAGEATFLTNCSACHATDLSATMVAGGTKIPLPGLPLTDHQWKFGGKPMQIFKLINEGSPADSTGNNGAKMQPWGQTLSPKQVAELVSFIIAKVPDDFKDIPAK